MKKLGIFLLSLFASVTALAQTTTLYPPAFGWYSYTLDSQGRPNTADYIGVIPILVKAVQEQQKEIESLKRQLRHQH